MTVLRSRLLARAQAERDAEAGALRNSQIGHGERAEKMRTYNFPQDRLTDKRLGHTLSGLERRLDGEIEDMIEELMSQDQADRLAQLEAGDA